MSSADQSEPRRLSTGLLAGLIVAPGLFAWFLLRRGYSNQLRVAAFTFAAINAAMAIGGALARQASPGS